MGMPVITPGTESRCQAISDIIESVALEQTAIAHILNAEGEKLQKITQTACNPNQLLAVNDSVQSMVSALTKLELLLQSKLELFAPCLCDKRPCFDDKKPCFDEKKPCYDEK